MICFAKPVLTETLYTVQKEEIFCNMLYVWYIHLTKGQAYSYGANPSSHQRGCYIRIMTARVQWSLWSWVSRGLTPRQTDWQETASHKVTLTLTLTLIDRLTIGHNMTTLTLWVAAKNQSWDGRERAIDWSQKRRRHCWEPLPSNEFVKAQCVL
jgi:hypothetical protein